MPNPATPRPTACAISIAKHAMADGKAIYTEEWVVGYEAAFMQGPVVCAPSRVHEIVPGIICLVRRAKPTGTVAPWVRGPKGGEVFEVS
eukprot:6658743-Pyramimonas_sp.AAC.1